MLNGREVEKEREEKVKGTRGEERKIKQHHQNSAEQATSKGHSRRQDYNFACVQRDLGWGSTIQLLCWVVRRE